MTPDQILVTVAGLAAAAGVAWFFWFKRAEGVKAATVSDGYQEQMILVKGGYTPDTIRVAAGRPVRLLFRRDPLRGPGCGPGAARARLREVREAAPVTVSQQPGHTGA